MTANEARPAARDDDRHDRERRAVDAATATRMQPGVRQDVHGEFSPDPFPDERDPDDDGGEVLARHRAHADAVEHAPAPDADLTAGSGRAATTTP